MKKWRDWIICMSIFSLLFSALTGCGKTDPVDRPDEQSEVSVPEVMTPMALPEGASLRHFYITHQGMRSGSHYILKTTEAGTYMKISNMGPGDWPMVKDEDRTVLGDQAEYLGFADTVKDCEYASLVLLEEDTPIRQLEESIAASGALQWDGYRESVAMPDVKDSGDRYILYLELTDGTSVTMDNYNVCPAGFMELHSYAEEIFQINQDYSHYMAADFDASPCTGLYVSFRKAFGKGEWKLELQENSGQWTVVLIDPEGTLLEASTEIADYRQMEGALPFERFLAIFKAHNAVRWNGYEEADGQSKEHFEIRLSFEDGKRFWMSGSLLPEGFEGFRKEMVEEIHLFYNEQKS